MKILHIAEPHDGGVICYLAMLLPQLEQSGIKQYLICSRKNLYSIIIKIWGVKKNCLSKKMLKLLKFLKIVPHFWMKVLMFQILIISV